jgi:hypothetical protein
MNVSWKSYSVFSSLSLATLQSAKRERHNNFNVSQHEKSKGLNCRHLSTLKFNWCRTRKLETGRSRTCNHAAQQPVAITGREERGREEGGRGSNVNISVSEFLFRQCWSVCWRRGEIGFWVYQRQSKSSECARIGERETEREKEKVGGR